MAESEEVSLERTIKQETLDLVTKEILEGAIRETDGVKNVTVHSFTVGPASKIGDNMATIVLRAKADVERDDIRREENFIVKVPQEKGWGEMSEKMNRMLFSKETSAYSKLLPAFVEIQEKLGVEPVVPVTPKFYFGRVGGGDERGMVIVEDLCPKGFQIGDKGKGYGLEECKLVMKELATWHALSLALKNKDLDTYRSKFEFAFSELQFGSLFGEMQSTWLKRAANNFVSTISESTSCSDEMKARAAKLETMDHLKIIQDVLKPVEPFSVITHGDSWGNNMMFRHESKDGAAKPVAIALIDLQVCRYALPLTDIAYFMFFNTSRETRKSHLKELLQVYHEKFVAVLDHMQFPCPEFTLEVVEGMFKQTAAFGWMFAMMVAPMFCCPPEVWKEFDGLTVEEYSDPVKAEEMKKKVNAKSAATIEKVMIGLLEDAIEHDII